MRLLDAGPTAHGVESTVLDPCQSPMVIYRPGAVTAEQIREVGGAVEMFQGRGRADGRRRARRCLRRAWGCGTMRRGRGWCWWRLGRVRLGQSWRSWRRGAAGERVGVMLPEGVASACGNAGLCVGTMGRAGGAGAAALCGAARAGRRGMHGDSVPDAGGRGNWGGAAGPAGKSGEQERGTRRRKNRGVGLGTKQRPFGWTMVLGGRGQFVHQGGAQTGKLVLGAWRATRKRFLGA